MYDKITEAEKHEWLVAGYGAFTAYVERYAGHEAVRSDNSEL